MIEDKETFLWALMTLGFAVFFVLTLVLGSIKQDVVKYTSQIEQTRLLTEAAKDITKKVMER